MGAVLVDSGRGRRRLRGPGTVATGDRTGDRARRRSDRGDRATPPAPEKTGGGLARKLCNSNDPSLHT